MLIDVEQQQQLLVIGPTSPHPVCEVSGQLLVVEAAAVPQSVVEGFSSQLQAQLHHVVLQGSRWPRQGVVDLVADLVCEHTGLFSVYTRFSSVPAVRIDGR